MKEKKIIIENFKGIIDTTLREGFQYKNANFSLKKKKKILSYLIEIGVDYVEVGNPAKREIQDMIIGLTRFNNRSSTKILSHIRNNEHDLQKVLEFNVNGVNILCTVDQERLASMKLSFRQYVDNLRKNILLAKENNLEVRISVEDFFSQDFCKSFRIYELAEKLGVERIGLADTLGRAMNWEVYKKIKLLRNYFTVDFEVHFHNDLGHAVSNALFALQAGANWISTSLLGIGERTGITPLSSFLVNLYILDSEISKRYNLQYLTPAENFVSRVCGIEMPLNLLTNRNNGFAHKAGIHLNALLNFGPQKYELVSPEIIGNRRKLVFNSSISGRTNKIDVMKFKKITDKN